MACLAMVVKLTVDHVESGIKLRAQFFAGGSSVFGAPPKMHVVFPVGVPLYPQKRDASSQPCLPRLEKERKQWQPFSWFVNISPAHVWMNVAWYLVSNQGLNRDWVWFQPSLSPAGIF